MTEILIREIAKEYGFQEIKAETSGLISFIKPIAHGRHRINYADRSQIVTLIITKDVKGFHNFIKSFHPIDHRLVDLIFHKPNSFRNAK